MGGPTQAMNRKRWHLFWQTNPILQKVSQNLYDNNVIPDRRYLLNSTFINKKRYF